MRLLVSGKGDNTYLYIVKSVRINGKSTTKVIENCGKLVDLKKEYEKFEDEKSKFIKLTKKQISDLKNKYKDNSEAKSNSL